MWSRCRAERDICSIFRASSGSHPVRFDPGADDRGQLVEYRDLAAANETEKYLKEYVHSVADHTGYLEHIGVTRLLGLRQTFR